MIDSHCHLAAPEMLPDIDAVLSRAKAAGIERMVTIGDTLADIEPMKALAAKYAHIFYTVGVHPHVASSFDLQSDLAILREATHDPKCRGIGEIGLDYHYMKSPKDTQQRVFEVQLVLAKELDLPAVIHCRDAVEDVWTIVNHVRPKKLVVHCCTEKWEDVQRFVDAGYLLSFTGIVTYPKSIDIRETVRQCPLSSLMVETDSPFLAPVPHRGKRNEPAYVIEVAKTIADIKQIALSEVGAQTTTNAVEFFGLPS